MGCFTYLNCEGTWPSFHGTGPGAEPGQFSGLQRHGESRPCPQSPVQPAGPSRLPCGQGQHQSSHNHKSSGQCAECTVKTDIIDLMTEGDLKDQKNILNSLNLNVKQNGQ